MKKHYLLLLWMIAACSCGNKDKFLLMQVPSVPVVNPDAKILIKNNTLLAVRLDSGNMIHGITSLDMFRTTDLFTHFDAAANTLSFATMPYGMNKHSIILASGTALSPVLNYSADDGFSWTAFSPVLTPALSATGFSSTKLISVYPVDAQTLLMLYLQQSSATGSYTRELYTINTTTKQGTLLYSAQGYYQPLAMKFTDAKTGWMTLDYFGTSITATTDGGATWSSPSLIDVLSMPMLEAGTNGALAVYQSNGRAWFSSNGGTTWKKTATTNILSTISFAGNAAAYALTNTGVVKSTDGGSTWNQVSAFGNGFDNVQKLFFRDEQQGLAYADQRLYITVDGGKSWKTLLYPYPYMLQ